LSFASEAHQSLLRPAIKLSPLSHDKSFERIDRQCLQFGQCQGTHLSVLIAFQSICKSFKAKTIRL